MAVDGGRLGRATNPSDNYSSHNNVKYCSWGVPRKGLSPFFFPVKRFRILLAWYLLITYYWYIHVQLKGVFIIYGFKGGSVFFRAPL